MKVPDNFIKGTYRSIVAKIETGEWVLVVTIDNSEKTKHLEYILSERTVREALSNFECFQIFSNSETANKLLLEYPVAIYIFAGKKTPYRIYNFDEPDFIDPEDIIQFLDDTTSFILGEGEKFD